jgi:hypothetical protein
MLARNAMATTDRERSTLAPALRHLATALADMARNLGDSATRQAAADRALDLASWLIVRVPPYRRSQRLPPPVPPSG